MPTYEYKCKACKHQFEQFQSMKDATLRKCPKCGKAKLERLIGTGAAVIFKGSGFYQTDYRSDSYKKGAKAESDSSKPAAATAETKAAPDSKPSAGSDSTKSTTKAEGKPDAKAKPPSRGSKKD